MVRRLRWGRGNFNVAAAQATVDQVLHMHILAVMDTSHAYYAVGEGHQVPRLTGKEVLHLLQVVCDALARLHGDPRKAALGEDKFKMAAAQANADEALHTHDQRSVLDSLVCLCLKLQPAMPLHLQRVHGCKARMSLWCVCMLTAATCNAFA